MASIDDQSELQKATEDRGYYGYRFKILKRQGANIAGGAYDYTINGNMIAGFGLVAWPVTYGETGIHIFVVTSTASSIRRISEKARISWRLASSGSNPNDNWVVTED
ncbi:hypothetical protein AJ87_06880 [Rhizobium yanglingense]|nr:hypothetical protein AJ87_06880 [Rhizobium yanglingense]